MFPAVFLDRDGVLIENRSDYIRDWSHVRIFPQALRALATLKAQSCKIIVVTNQSAVGRGLVSIDIVQEINNKLVKISDEMGGKIDKIYTCPHTPEDGCECRKPKPGLLLQAAQDLSIDLQRSWMIGDAWSDLLAGQAAGVQGVVLLKTGRGAEQLLQSQPENLADYFVFNDLSDAISSIRTLIV